MNLHQQLIIIALVALATAATRFLPFLLFGSRKTPSYLTYLGRVLPVAVFGMLVVYALKGTSFTAPYFALPELIGVLAVAVLHLLFRKTLLSIVGGTALYILLVNLVFV